MTVRDELHRLVDAVPEARLPELVETLRELAEPPPALPREFSCAGTLSAEHDLAERSEDILRDEDGGAAA